MTRIKIQIEEIDMLARRGFSLGCNLSSGGFGVVYHAMFYQRPIACKMIDVASFRRSQYKYLPREIFMLTRLRHPNIMEIIALFILQSDQLLIFMELAQGGDLQRFIDNRLTWLTEAECINFYKQFGSALFYMHQNGFAHRDIKPLNVLLDRTFTKCKVSDFGLSAAVFDAQTGEETMTKSLVGTRTYMAPEMNRIILEGTGQYNPMKSDVWSCGIMLYVMLNYRDPYKRKAETFDRKDMLAQQMNLSRNLHNVMPNKRISPKGFNMLWKHLVPNPDMREGFDTLMQHPWLLPEDN